ncbi:MAG: IucA/IucC family protein, partial [Myxococcota bacterium]
MISTPETSWRRANQRLAARILSELSHERLIEPVYTDGSYLVRVADRDVAYRFSARRYQLDHWSVDETSILRDGASGFDASLLILDLAPILAMRDEVLETYLEELTATASSLAFHFENQRFDAVNLAAAEFQDIESSMSAGHPCFVANSGRIGFNSEEYGRFAPEANTQFPLEWVAVSKERAHFCSIGVNYAEHMERELGAERLQQFEQSLSDLNLHPDDYLYMPIHPWQWSNRIATVFADEIARR